MRVADHLAQAGGAAPLPRAELAVNHAHAKLGAAIDPHWNRRHRRRARVALEYNVGLPKVSSKRHPLEAWEPIDPQLQLPHPARRHRHEHIVVLGLRRGQKG